MEAIISLVMGLLVGTFIFGAKNMEEVSKWVKANPCVERLIGDETIKKCYVLKEVKPTIKHKE